MGGLVHTKLGERVFVVSPSLVPFAKNSTFATLPSASDAVAFRVMDDGARKYALLVGLMSAMLGVRLRMIAGIPISCRLKLMSELVDDCWCISTARRLVPATRCLTAIMNVSTVSSIPCPVAVV